jgi:hypothetical protein
MPPACNWQRNAPLEKAARSARYWHRVAGLAPALSFR